MTNDHDDRRRSTQRIHPLNLHERLNSMRGNSTAGNLLGVPLRGSVAHTSSNYRKSHRGTILHLHPLCREGKVRQFLYDIVESKSFHIFMLVIILTNTALIGFQTMEDIEFRYGWYLELLGNFYLAVYMIEFIVKFCAIRFKYFKDKWNLFDFFIVVTSLFDYIWSMTMINNSLSVGTDLFKVFRLLRSFRALRALRVIRTIKFLKNLQITVNAIIKSLPALGSIIMLIGLVLYIFAIIGKGLFREQDPTRFGNIGRASFTLFQLITLDDWYLIYTDARDDKVRNDSFARDDKEINTVSGNPHLLFLYLCVFIVLENFIFINLFIAVIVDNLEKAHANAREESLQITPSVESMDSREVVTAMALDEEQVLEEVPPSSAVEYYYEGRRDSATKHIAMFTERLATLEYYTERNQTHIRNLNKLLDLAKKSNH